MVLSCSDVVTHGVLVPNRRYHGECKGDGVPSHRRAHRRVQPCQVEFNCSSSVQGRSLRERDLQSVQTRSSADFPTVPWHP